jgi:hypothetical protein
MGRWWQSWEAITLAVAVLLIVIAAVLLLAPITSTIYLPHGEPLDRP